MSTAALYARVSSDEQAAHGYGLAAQLHELREHASRKGYRIVEEYADDGYSGATLDRPALTRLRDAVRVGALAVVLVADPDRLSRRLAHQLLLLEELEQRTRVEFLTTPRGTTPEGALLLNVKAVIGEYERERIRDRTLGGKRQKARAGKVVSGSPYGFRPDAATPGALVVYEPEAATVRMLHEWLVEEGKSTRAITAELRALGVPSRTGRGWSPTQVRRLLSSPIYSGTTVYNRQQVVGGRRKVRPESEWISIQIPAILTAEQHAAALAALARNRTVLVGRPAHFVYLLRGLLRCSACGARYTSVPAAGRRYYRCAARDRFSRGPRCRSPWISANVAEQDVWQSIADALRNPAILRAGVERYEAQRGARDVEVRSRVEGLARKVRAVQAKETRLVDLYAEGGIDKAAVTGRLRELGRERERLAAELRHAEARLAEHDAAGGRLAAIERWAAEARKGIDKLDDAGRQTVLRGLVDEVVVGADRRLTIHGLLPDPAPSGMRRPSRRVGCPTPVSGTRAA